MQIGESRRAGQVHRPARRLRRRVHLCRSRQHRPHLHDRQAQARASRPRTSSRPPSTHDPAPNAARQRRGAGACHAAGQDARAAEQRLGRGKDRDPHHIRRRRASGDGTDAPVRQAGQPGRTRSRADGCRRASATAPDRSSLRSGCRLEWHGAGRGRRPEGRARGARALLDPAGRRRCARSIRPDPGQLGTAAKAASIRTPRPPSAARR